MLSPRVAKGHPRAAAGIRLLCKSLPAFNHFSSWNAAQRWPFYGCSIQSNPIHMDNWTAAHHTQIADQLALHNWFLALLLSAVFSQICCRAQDAELNEVWPLTWCVAARPSQMGTDPSEWDFYGYFCLYLLSKRNGISLDSALHPSFSAATAQPSSWEFPASNDFQLEQAQCLRQNQGPDYDGGEQSWMSHPGHAMSPATVHSDGECVFNTFIYVSGSKASHLYVAFSVSGVSLNYGILLRAQHFYLTSYCRVLLFFSPKEHDLGIFLWIPDWLQWLLVWLTAN